MAETTPKPPPGSHLPDDIIWQSRFGLADGETGWVAFAREALAPPPTLGRLGSYELLAEIGRGAQGSVFKAVQPGTQRVVAVKRLAAGALATPGMRARFEREIEAICRLSHPGIVTVHGVELIDAQPILTMEFVDAQPIDRWAMPPDASQPRPTHDILAVFTRVCDAVHHAHQRGVIHRDLKPSNILVDDAGHPRVLDFGLARLTSDAAPPAASVTQGFLGTPAYASPEQIDGHARDVDARSDIYSLGVVLYELLTGAWPYAAPGQTRPDPSLPGVFDAIRRTEPRRPSAIRADLGTELDAILLKAIARDPHDRYHSADALADDLRRFLAGQTVLAHPPTTLYQLRKLVRRHRAAFVIGVVIAAIVVLAAIISTTLAVQLARQRDDLVASQQRERDQHAAADQARERAEAEARKVLASSAFLKELLLTSDPAMKLRPDIGLRELLVEACRSLDAGALADQPEVEAAARTTVGQVYTRLRLPREGEPQLRRALEILTALSGDRGETLDLADTLSQLGLCLSEQRKFAEGIPLHRRALDMRRRLAPDDLETLMRRIWTFTSALRDDAQDAEAEALTREALDISIRLNGPHHTDTAEARVRLALVLFFADKPAAAEQEYRAALVIQRDLLGPRHPSTGETTYRLAQTLVALHQVPEADSLMTEGIEILMESLGPLHPSTIRARTMMARYLAGQGRLEESDRLYTDIFTNYNAYYGPLSLNAAGCAGEWARVLVRRGDLSNAESLLRQSLAIYSADPSDIDPRIQAPRLTLIQVLTRRAAFTEAEEILRAAQATAASLPPALQRRVADEALRLYRAWNAAEPSDALAASLRQWQATHDSLRDPPKPDPETEEH